MCNRYRQGNTHKVKLGTLFNARPLNNEPLPHAEMFPKRQGAVIRTEAGERLVGGDDLGSTASG